MTVAYRGPRWLETTIRRLDISWFDRAVGLRLSGQDVDDNFIGRLRHLDHLQSLSLFNTSVSAGALDQLLEHLPECKVDRGGIDITVFDAKT